MQGEMDDTLDKQQVDQELNNEEKHILEQKQQILNNSGVLAAYEYFLRRLCKDGFPSGNVYEYAAQAVLKYEKKKQAEQFRQQTMAKSLAELQLNEKLKAQLQASKIEVKADPKNDKNDKNKSPQKGNKDQKEKNPKDQNQGKNDKKDTKAQDKTDPKQKKK